MAVRFLGTVLNSLLLAFNFWCLVAHAGFMKGAEGLKSFSSQRLQNCRLSLCTVFGGVWIRKKPELGCLPASQTTAPFLLSVTEKGEGCYQRNETCSAISVKRHWCGKSARQRSEEASVVNLGTVPVSNLHCVCRYLSASSTLEDWNEKLTQSEAWVS